MAKQQAPKAAASTSAQPQKASKGHTVLSSFRDRDNWDKEYNPGDDVSHFDKERLETLVKNGLVQAPKGSTKASGVTSFSDTPPTDNEGGDGNEDSDGEEGNNGEE